MNHELQELIDAGAVVFMGDRLARYFGNDLVLLAECGWCEAPILESASLDEDICESCWAMDGVDPEDGIDPEDDE